jgi:hypothetical protein
VLLAAGCGGRGTISGHVKLNGKPVPLGTISFHCQEGRREVCNALVRDGAYSAAGVPVGPARVTVVSSFTPAAGEGAAAGRPGQATGKTGRGAAGPPTIPRRYGDLEQSGLSLRVTTGAQVFDVDVQP